MNELQVPVAGRTCDCGTTMVRARSSSLRWRCPSCKALSERDLYLDSVARGAPMLPDMPLAPAPITRWVLHFEGHPYGPNDRPHYHQKNRDAKKWHALVKVQVDAQRIPNLGRVKLSAVFYRRNLNVADEDNDRARLKPVCDALVRQKIIPKDTRAFVVWGDVTEEHGPTGFALVIEALP